MGLPIETFGFPIKELDFEGAYEIEKSNQYWWEERYYRKEAVLYNFSSLNHLTWQWLMILLFVVPYLPKLLLISESALK